MTAAQQAVVAKCGPSPTPEPGGIGTCGAIICGPESNAHFQQRQAIYALCSRDDPSYAVVLTEFIRTENARRQAPVSPPTTMTNCFSTGPFANCMSY